MQNNSRYSAPAVRKSHGGTEASVNGGAVEWRALKAVPIDELAAEILHDAASDKAKVTSGDRE